MRNSLHLLAIRRDERYFALVTALLLSAVGILITIKYDALITNTHRWFLWKYFKCYQYSGFDPIPYAMVSDWQPDYEVGRHPLLALIYYPLFLINQLLKTVTGKNCALYLLQPMTSVLYFYALLWFRRVLTDIMTLKSRQADISIFLLMSFGYMMVTTGIVDHFVPSLFLLSLTLYLSGKALMSQGKMTAGRYTLLFIFAAGTTLTNGIKVMLAALATEGRQVFTQKYVLAFLSSILILLGCGIMQQKIWVEPQQREQQIAQARKDSLSAEKARRQHKVFHKKTVKSIAIKHADVPVIGDFLDLSTPRDSAIVENVIGEPVLLHEDHLLEDIWKNRPIFITYHHAWQYMLIGLVVVLFLMGCWQQRHSRFFCLCLSWWLVDMVIHVVLGFTLNEVYIMSPHWLPVVAIAIAGLMQSRQQKVLTPIIMFTAIFLFFYNGTLLLRFLLA